MWKRIFILSCYIWLTSVMNAFAQTPCFEFAQTGIPYPIVIGGVDVNNCPISVGDVIAVFDDTLCVGAVAYDGEYNLSLTAWEGDPPVDLPGFTPGNPMTFKICDTGCDEIFDAAATYEIGDSTFGFGIYTKIYLNAEFEPNCPPTNIYLINLELNGDSPIGTIVGSFITIDPDGCETFAYSLAHGEGDHDNDLFQIVGDELTTAQVIGFDSQTLSIRVQTADSFEQTYEKTFTIDVLSIEESISIQENQNVLWQNYPNPFCKQTAIRFQIAQSAPVKIDIFDITGRQIHTLANSQFSAGLHNIPWNGENRFGQIAGKGVYLLRLTAPGFTDCKQLIRR
ncbi:MAG: hypothetical protein B6244_03915 [Candidatus Cloacimonetes bacterium 4572_55]|nr:MAG: hypothetical protein B6244_03915 [Candidatus Cloacimonetes bacterium 4572_55]